jgi:uncharacterized protein (DUF302 family)
MYDRSYALTRSVGRRSQAETVQQVRQALQKEGFGVLTEIDVQATLKAKLGVERKPYLILGACNPPLAHRALEAEPPIGVLLPCNVDVFEGEDGNTYVQALRPSVAFRLVENPAVAPIAQDVEQRLLRVLESL